MTGIAATPLTVEPFERIDRAWLTEHGRFVFEMHLALQDCHRLLRHVADKRTGAQIGLHFVDISWKRHKRNGEKAGKSERQWFVIALDEALEILAIVRQGERPA